VELDRQFIEKRDFAIGRRGYEPEDVDTHLARVADEVESLRRQARHRGGESLAAAAATQVQAIVEAAETTADEIERLAEAEAHRIRTDAERAAERTKEDALARATAQVEAVTKATQQMLQRVDAMEGELTALTESLRTGAGRLTADLSLLQGSLGELHVAAGRRAAALEDDDEGDEPVSAAAPTPAPAPASATTASTAPAPAPEPPAPAEPAPAAVPSSDVDGARLVALNMALNGQSREETDRNLAENFELSDRASLLDEVYAAVEG
jgi:DivIVA domain-containing protein